MSFRLPPANTLRFFEAAARLRSFKHAADEVHVTPSAISHGISTLENWLGVRLFHRNGRVFSLSEAGESYLPEVRTALAMLASATERLPGRGAPGRVIVGSPAEFASLWLVGRIGEFVQMNPKIQIKIETEDRPMPVGYAPDISIKRSAPVEAPSSWIKLADDRSVPVCSPAYRSALGGGDDIAQLRKANLVRLPSEHDDWDTWLATTGVRGPMRLSGIQVDTVQLALQAALRGLGVALCPVVLADHDCARGHLVEVGTRALVGRGSYWLVDNCAARSESELFRAWLLGQFATNEEAPGGDFRLAKRG